MYQPSSSRTLRTVCFTTGAPERCSSHASNSTRRIECCTHGTFTYSPFTCTCRRSNVRKRCGYEGMSRSRSRTTSGVIHPAHSFRRGNSSLSSTSTSAPPSLRRRAAEEPAGPPPTMRTSHVCTFASALACRARVEVRARHRHVVVALRREQHLEQLQCPGREARDRAGQIQPPHTLELLVEHGAHLRGIRIEELEPVSERLGVVQAQVLHVENREIPRLEDLHELG